MEKQNQRNESILGGILDPNSRENTKDGDKILKDKTRIQKVDQNTSAFDHLYWTTATSSQDFVLKPTGLLCPWDFSGKNRSGFPFPPSGVLPNPGMEPRSLELAGKFFTTEPPEKPISQNVCNNIVRCMNPV